MSVQSGFGATMGVILALVVVFVGLPILAGILFCGGLLAVGTQVPPPPPTAAAPATEKPTGDAPLPAEADPVPEAVPAVPAEIDRDAAAEKKLSLARQLLPLSKRKIWLEEIIRDYPETDAAAEAAKLSAEIRE